MKDRRLDRLFERYRRRGDVEALGKVFDLASGELLGVAMFLARSPAAAEDLLQATFVTAIERAERYDGKRTLLPWLLGILVHHAHVARRRAQRVPDPERLEARAPADPHAELEARELDGELERALARLSARERDVLEPFLRQGKAPVELARERGLAPGTVRMQIHRGLARLRELLPAGLALGGALLVTGGRGTAEVRASVLRAGARAAPCLAAAGAGTASIAPLVLGGLLVAKKIVLVVLSIALVGVLAWIARDGLGGARGEPVAAAPTAETPLPAPSPEPAHDLVARAADPVAAPEPARIAVNERASTPAPSAYEAALAGVTGRLVEPDGTPAAGVDVRLLEVAIDRVQNWLGAGVGTESELEEELARGLDPLVARVRTDREGRFLLRGARPDALHAIAGGNASPRVPLRLIGEPLEPGLLVDLGDVVLRERARVRGSVRDEQGRPVAGARVRAGILPDEVFGVGFTDLFPDSALAFQFDEPPIVTDLPAWIARLEDHLGLAVGRTGPDGNFELDDVPAGDVDLVVDGSGYVTNVQESVPLAPGADLDLGALTLATGGTVRGRVLAVDGTSRAGVRLWAGGDESAAHAPFWLLRAAGSSGADGRFTITGFAAGRRLVAAHPDELAPWVVVRVPDGEDCEIRLPGSATLTLRVEDERGAPIAGATPRLDPNPLLAFLPKPFKRVPELGRRARETSAGTFVIEGLPFGPYACSASAPGLLAEPVGITIDSASAEAKVVLAPTRRIAVRVVDDAGSAPIAGAFVSLGSREVNGIALSSTRSGPDGRAELEVRRDEGREPGDLYLRATHPGFAAAYRAAPFDGATTELRLSAGGALHSVLDPTPVDGPPFLLTLWMQDAVTGLEIEGLRVLRLDERGEARSTHLVPGHWNFVLVEGWAKDADMVALLGGHEPDDVQKGEFEIRAGETTELVIQAGRLGSTARLGSGTGTVEGRVTIDGEPARGVRVMLQGEDEQAPPVDVGADGSFLFTDVPSGRIQMIVQTATGAPRRATEPAVVHFESFELAPGETKTLDFDWSTTRIVFHVLDEDGAPVPEIQLDVDGETTRTSVLTDRSGAAAFALIGSGTFRATASGGERGIGRAEFTVREGESVDPIEIRLTRGVPCAGTVRTDEEESVDANLFIRGPDGDPVMASVELVGGTGTFRAYGLSPGKQTAYLFGPEREYALVEFVLDADGNDDLELVFRPQ